MARIFFQCAKQGYRSVRGAEILRMQLALKKAGLAPGKKDEVFGRDTTAALKKFQQLQSFEVTGSVTEDTYERLLGRAAPSMLARCLQITGDIEGHGFCKVAGNWDNAGLTWGIIGFTIKSGQVQQILLRVARQHPEIFNGAFGGNADEMRRVLALTREAQMRWADGISIGNKRRVQESWENAFEGLGAREEVQVIQLERVGKYWDRAAKDAARFGLRSELGLALCFDIAVQNGGIDTKKEERIIRGWQAGNPGASEAELRAVIADTVADNSLREFAEDVRARKKTFATGQGQIHGALTRWRIGGWPRLMRRAGSYP